MFDVSHSYPGHHPDHPSGAAQQSRNVAGLMSPLSDQAQKIFLPRGSAQSRFEPPSYFYLASDSGVLPRWAVDEACHKDAGAQ